MDVVHYGHWEICDEPRNSEEFPLYHIATANEGSWMDVYFAVDGSLYRHLSNMKQWMKFIKPEVGAVDPPN